MSRPITHVTRVLLLAALLAGAEACSSRGRPAIPSEPATVAVDNRAFSDMTVYVLETNGARRRLGLATGLTTTTFTIPATLVGLGRELHFVVDPVGSSRTAVSNRAYVVPGDNVRLVIPPG